MDVIRVNLEDRGQTKLDLVGVLGSRAVAAEMFGRRRAVTVGMIRKLRATYGISADLLIADHDLVR